MIQHYLTVALRNLLKNKGQTLISITGLAVGLFCFALCTYLIRYWMNEDNSFKNKKQIAEIILVKSSERPLAGTPNTVGIELQNKQIPLIERITRAVYNNPKNLSFEISKDKTLPYQLYLTETDTNFMTVFDRQLLLGDLSVINKQPNILLLSQSTTKKIYGNDNPIGKKVIDKDQKAYTIGGVFEDFPANNSFSSYEPVEVLAISVLDGFLEQLTKESTGCKTYALIRPEYKPDHLDKQLQNMKYMADFANEQLQVRALPLGQTKYDNLGYKIFYGFIFLIGLLIFLSALLNYFSFMTGNFYNRIKEFSIRKGIGEDRIHLFTLLFTETFLSLLFTGILALCLTELFVPGLQFSFFRIQLEFDSLLLSGQIMEYLLFCIALSAIICGTVCIRLNKISLIEGIRFSRHRVRNTLLGIQYFIALFFLSGAAAATLQTWAGEKQLFSSLTNEEKERIFFVRTDHKYMESTYQVLLSKWKGNSLIEDILEVRDKLPNTRINSYVWGDDEQKTTVGGVLHASANVCSFLHLKPLAGTLQLDEQSLLINEAFMKAIKENPINQTVRMNNDSKGYRINGVTSSLLRFVDGDEYFASLAIALLQEQGNCYIRIREGKEKEGKAYLEQTVKEFLPESIQPEVYTLKDECLHIQTTERMLRNVFSFFAAVCLIITLLGIYAAISQDTERRRKEVAIRIINGASLKNILYLFTRLYMKLLLIATLFVFPLMWIITDLMLKNWVIRFNYNNPLFWFGIFFIIMAFTAVVILVKILRTARINPAEVIKTE